MSRKCTLQLVLCLVLIGVNLAFIWGNSLLPGSQSSELSGGIMVWLEETLGEGFAGTEFLLRKLAHFSEFACLGLLLAWLFLMLGQKGVHRITMPLLFGNLAACLDETIQVFRPDRGPSVIDVWIDTAGVLTGVLVLLLFHSLYTHLRNQHKSGGN